MILNRSEAYLRENRIVELPWPSRILHPNARPHWGAKARETKKARQTAAWAAKAAGLKPLACATLRVTAVFVPPDARQRDDDGMLSNIKAYLDGIADVIGVNDSRWTVAIRREPPKAPGTVRIELEEGQPA